MNTTTAPRTGQMRMLLAVAALAWLLLCLPSAVAQSNKLFGPRRREAQPGPTTQPAEGAPRSTAGQRAGVGGAFGIRGAVQQEMAARRPNGMLLATSPFAVALPEPEVIQVNDLVTIIVRVSKTASSKSKLDSKKDWKHEWELSKWIRFSDLHGLIPAEFPVGNPAVAFDYKDDWKGDGKYDRKDELTTRIQATVIDVKPNGTLILEARNRVHYGAEAYAMTLTGTCRSRDVTPQNTVLSSQIANLEVDVTDMGAVRDATRRGWFKRGLDLLRPF